MKIKDYKFADGVCLGDIEVGQYLYLADKEVPIGPLYHICIVQCGEYGSETGVRINSHYGAIDLNQIYTTKKAVLEKRAEILRASLFKLTQDIENTKD